jgi:hypothetical protein
MKYACLCYEDQRALKALSKSQSDAIVRQILVCNEELARKGRLTAAQALQSVETTVTVRVRTGAVSATDGPFAETKEQFGGSF